MRYLGGTLARCITYIVASEPTKPPTALEQLPRPEQVREQLDRARRDYYLLRRLLELSERTYGKSGDRSRGAKDAA